MKRVLTAGAIVLAILVFVPLVHAQADDEVLSKKQVQAEVAADSDQYVIGAEDVLYVHVWKEDTLSKTVPVRMDGKISLPLIEEVHAAGMTPLQLKETLTGKFKQYLDNPVVFVTVMEANSFKVFLSGQIRTPGVYRLRTETTLVQVIPMAGGFTEAADQGNITVIRKENGKEKRIVLNYKKIMSGEAMNSNIGLKSGDTVFVPQVVEPFVKKQSLTEVETDSDRYVIGPEDVLSIYVWREEALSRTVPVRADGNISLPLVHEVRTEGFTPRQLREVLTKRLKEFIENPIVSVTVMETNSLKVYVSGQVKTPGVYRLRSETTLLQIIPMAGGFTEWANQKKILVIRKEDGKEKRITVNYKKIVDGDKPDSNIALKAGDTIVVP